MSKENCNNKLFLEQTEPCGRTPASSRPTHCHPKTQGRSLRGHGGIPRTGLEGHQLDPRTKETNPRLERAIPHQGPGIFREDGRPRSIVHRYGLTDRNRSGKGLPYDHTRTEESPA